MKTDGRQLFQADFEPQNLKLNSGNLKLFCGGRGIRTPDIQLAKLALYQLSYTPVKVKRHYHWLTPWTEPAWDSVAGGLEILYRAQLLNCALLMISTSSAFASEDLCKLANARVLRLTMPINRSLKG